MELFRSTLNFIEALRLSLELEKNFPFFNPPFFFGEGGARQRTPVFYPPDGPPTTQCPTSKGPDSTKTGRHIRFDDPTTHTQPRRTDVKTLRNFWVVVANSAALIWPLFMISVKLVVIC